MTFVQTWGWTPFVESFYEDALSAAPATAAWLPARVIGEERGWYRLIVPQTGVVVLGQVAGAFRHAAESRESFPAVGDWVVITRPRNTEDRVRIEALLPRRTCLRRKSAGRGAEAQVLAAQIDEVLVVTSCNQDINERRLERALALVADSGARARLLLSKADLLAAEARAELRAALAERFVGLAIEDISIHEPASMARLRASLVPGETYIVLGSSGVGKSSLINALTERAVQVVSEIRTDDDKGRHTTVARSLHALSGGALIIDTPGIREIQFASEQNVAGGGFADITELQQRCRFGNCSHQSEPGCAVQSALADGSLESDRWENYQKILREVAHQKRRESKALQSAARQGWAKLSRNSQARKRFERGDDR